MNYKEVTLINVLEQIDISSINLTNFANKILYQMENVNYL